MVGRFIPPAMLLVAVLLKPADARPVAPQGRSDLAARIDHRLETRFKAEGVKVAPQADDAEFLRPPTWTSPAEFRALRMSMSSSPTGPPTSGRN